MKDKDEMINEKFKDITTVTVRVTMPINIWEEWNDDCNNNFNGTRYLKMKLDHDFRHQFKSVGEMIIEDLEELRARVAELENIIEMNEIEKEQDDDNSSSKRMTFEERRLKAQRLNENDRK